jgi:ppGpp synthetase/RelA/SpoT-type nucleotidyltranferase
MKHMLRTDYAGINPESLEKGFKDCCSEYDRCSEDLMKIADAINALYRMKPEQYVGKVSDLEHSLKKKCQEIKKQRAIIHKLLS